MIPDVVLKLVEIAAAIAAFFAAAMVGRAAFARRTIHLWINLLSALWLMATGCEFLVRALTASGAHLSPITYTARMCMVVAVFAIAVLVVPFSRRIRRAKDYDELHRMTEELKNTDLLLDSFMNAMPWPAFIKDRSGRLVYVNERFTAVSKRSKEETIGRRTQEWVTPEQGELISKRNEEVFAANKKLLYPSSVTSDGVTSLFPLPMQDGEPYLGGIISAPEKQLHLESTAKMLASIVECSSDAIYTISEDRLITSWNRGAVEMFGYRPEEIIGKPLTTITPLPRRDEAPRWRVSLDSGELVTDRPTVRQTKDGREIPVLVSACRIPSLSGAGLEFAGITRDISSLRRAEEELRRVNDQLQLRAEELQAANKALEIARDDALAASNMKSAFVSSVSHELHTPLSGVLGLSELLLQQLKEESARNTVRTIYESAQALLTIVNDILDLSKLESGTVDLTLRTFSPVEVIEECVSLLSPAARAKGLTVIRSVEPAVPDQLYGDPHRLRQILLNLIGNAIKFTVKGSVSIRVKLQAQAKHLNTLLFEVEDTGAGIDPSDSAQLFSPFSRVERNTKGVGGTGLGLVICKRLIELMGGEIEFNSRLGVGSTFWFSIPFDTAPEESKRVSPLVSALRTAPELLVRHRILVVEDNPVLCELAARQLSYLGAKADVVYNGRDALERHAAQNYEIILLDIHLPDLSGHEVARQIRASEVANASEGAVIIAMTAGAMPGDREKALSCGMNDHLSKPVDLALLGETVLRWAKDIAARRATSGADQMRGAG
jgi:PAS domain S-box-containing protein